MTFPTNFLLVAALWLAAALPSFSQISNDDCTSATVLDIGTGTNCGPVLSGTTLGAKPSGIGECAPQHRDAWYRFTATTATHTIRLANVKYVGFGQPSDFYLEAFSGDCANLRHLFCVYGGSWNGGSSVNSEIRWGDLVPGAAYCFRVYNPSNSDITFEVCMGTPPPPPANDACATATALPVSPDADCAAPTAGTTQNAGISPIPATLQCMDCWNYDVWYSFTATQATHRIALTDVVNADKPSEMQYLSAQLFSGNCANPVFAQKSAVTSGSDALVANQLTPGQTYLLRVAAYYYTSAVPISFNICVTSPPPPANDECAGALPIVPVPGLGCSTSFTGSLYAATPSGKDCKGQAAVNDVWYKFVATSPSHRISVAPPNTADASTYGFEVYSGDCASPVSLLCSNQVYAEHLLAHLTVGATYYLRVFSPTYKSFDFQVCILTLPPPPVHDECAGALPLAVNAEITCDAQTLGTTLGANSSRPSCDGLLSTHDVWYKFVATAPAMRTVVTLNAAVFGTYGQFAYEVLSGDCNNLSSLVCTKGGGSYYPEQTLSGLTPGATYYLRVYSDFESNHEFSVCVQTLPPPPPNSDCAQAQTLLPGLAPNCTNPVSGNTTGILTLGPAQCTGEGKGLWYSFTATGATHTLLTSNVKTIIGYGGYWAAELYEGTDCGSLTYLRCYENPRLLYLNALTVGRTYYIRWVSGYGASHSFDLCLGAFPVPPNDDCANATTLPVSTNLTCNPTPATTAGSTWTGQPFGCFDQADVWFRFTATQAAHYISVNDGFILETGYRSPMLAELWSGECGTGSRLYCWHSDITYGYGTLVAGDLTPGTTYYLRIAAPENRLVNFKICVTTPPVPPANDACANAVMLSTEPGYNCHPVSGTTLHATPSPGVSYLPCCDWGDVWYAFVATQANQTVSLLNEVNWSFQSAYIGLYISGCAQPTQLAEQKMELDGPFLLTNLNPGTTYYLRVYSIENERVVRFRICVSAPPPPVNDECANALPLPVNDDLTCANALEVSTAAATASALGGCNGGQRNDVWYQFTAAAADYQFELNTLSSSKPLGYGASGYEVLGGDCDHLTSIYCEEEIVSSVGSRTQGGFVLGKTYYVRFFSTPYVEHLLRFCARTLPPPPVNDVCSGALPLTVQPDLSCDVPTLGSTLGATESPLPDLCYGGENRDVWYTFEATSATHLLEIEVTKTYFNGVADLAYQVYAGDCGDLDSIFCQRYFTQKHATLHDLVPGQRYYVRLASPLNQADDFTLCLKTLPPPPAHDECAGAVIFDPNLPAAGCAVRVQGSTLGATASLPSGCAGATGQDVWYAFAAISHSHWVEVTMERDYFGSPNDLVYQVYTGDCENLSEVLCANTLQQGRKWLHNLTPGQTYYVRVLSRGVQAHDFALCVQSLPLPPTNDLCANAEPMGINLDLSCSALASGTTLGATFEPGVGRPDVWFSFVPTSSTHVFELRNTQVVLGTPVFSSNLQAYVFKGDDCGHLQFVTYFFPYEQRVLNDLEPDATYYISVVCNELDVASSFDLCINTIPAPPPNEECAGAIPLTVSAGEVCDVVHTLSTAGATTKTDVSQYCGAGNDVWYSFTATAAEHWVQVSNQERLLGYGSLLVQALGSADCSAFEALGCVYENGQMYLYGLNPGTVYYLRASSDVGSAHRFDLCIKTIAPPPNDLCINAILIETPPQSAYSSELNGTTTGAASSGLAPCWEDGQDVWYAFTATQSAHHVNIWNVFDARYPAPAYFGFEVYADGCGGLQPLVCRNGLFLQNQYTVGDLTVGHTYYVRVRSKNGAIDFLISIGTPPTPPDNDACAGAIELAVSAEEPCTASVTGTTENATETFAGSGRNDVWYKFVAMHPTHLFRSNDLSPEPSPDGLYVRVYTGICGALAEVKRYTYAPNLTMVSSLTPGETYYVQVSGSGNSPIAFDLCTNAVPPPANDECAGATPLVVSTDFQCPSNPAKMSSYGATQSEPSCLGTGANDIWFQFVASDPAVRLDVRADGGNSYYHPFSMEVYTGDCGTLTTEVPCEWYDYGHFTRGWTLHNLLIGNTYYIRLAAQPGEYLDFEVCARALPAPPANDECTGAATVQPNTGIACDLTYTGSTIGATQSLPDCEGYRKAHDVWYQFVATSTRHVMDAQAVGAVLGTSNILGVAVYAGDCDNLGRLQCTTSDLGALLDLNDLTVGETYYVRVFSWYEDGHDFTLCIRTPPPPPANVDCALAEVVVPSADLQCSNPTAGSTAGLSNGALWYQFTATSDAHIIEFQDTANLYGYSYLAMELYTGTCDALDFLYYASGSLQLYAPNLSPGTTYYVLVFSGQPSAIPFNLCVLTVPPPANEDCAGAVLLPVSPENTCGTSVEGSTLGAHTSGGLGCADDAADVFYAFVATSTRHTVRLSHVQPETPDGTYFLMEILDGECGNWAASLGCYGASDQPMLSDLVPGKTYYLRLAALHPYGFRYDICVSTPQPDLYLYQLGVQSDGCKPGQNETVEAGFVNYGQGQVPTGAAQFTLTLSGANTGTYGPLSNTAALNEGEAALLLFNGVDLSNPGETELSLKAVLPYNLSGTEQTLTATFASLTTFATYYRDADFDGYGDPAQPFGYCYLPAGYAENSDDCDDANPWANPSITEVCNGYDDDCDGLTDAADPSLEGAPPPSIYCPYDRYVVHEPGSCSVVQTYELTTYDYCGYTVTQTEGLASGEDFPVGTTLNSFTVSAPDGSTATCSFRITVEKTPDPDLVYAYTVIGLNDVFLKKNTVATGGVGVTGAGKKVRLPLGTIVSDYAFVKAPVLELTGSSQAQVVYPGAVPASLLPAFKPNSSASSNHLTVPNNAAPVTLPLASYGTLTVGINATVTFTGQATVRIGELTLKEGATVLFDQNTELLIARTMAVGRKARFNPSGLHTVRCFAGKNVTANSGAEVQAALLYTAQDLRLEKASAALPIHMTGLFIASNVYAQDFAQWQWNAAYCPVSGQKPGLAERQEKQGDVLPPVLPKPLQIFPNPASEEAQVVFDLEKAGDVTLRLLDAAGHLVRTEQVAGLSGANTFHLRLGHLPEGVYLVQLLAEGERWSERLVVLRD